MKKWENLLLNYIIAIGLGIVAGIIVFMVLSPRGLTCINDPVTYLQKYYNITIACYHYPLGGVFCGPKIPGL